MCITRNDIKEAFRKAKKQTITKRIKDKDKIRHNPVYVSFLEKHILRYEREYHHNINDEL